MLTLVISLTQTYMAFTQSISTLDISRLIKMGKWAMQRILPIGQLSISRLLMASSIGMRIHKKSS